MQISLTALDVKQLVKELQALIGAYIDNIYQYGRQDILFQLRKGKLVYLRILPHIIWITKHKETAPEKVGGFCAQLRKLLNNNKILSIEQIGSERIILIKTKEYEIYAELFGKGNIVVTKDLQVVAAQFSMTYHDREIAIGKPYQPPCKENLFELKTIKLGGEPISKTLAKFGLGKIYAEELCNRTGTSPHALIADETEILKELKQIIKEVQPTIYDETISVISLQNKKGKKYETLSEAIDSVMPELINEARTEESPETKQQEKLQKTIMLQEKHIEELKKEEQENKRKAELLYENYQKIDLLLKELQKYHKTPHWQAVVENAKPLLKSVDEKNRKIIITLK